ncbi:hypothetical protein EV360DRAFT_91111 [Lentinula raphanica]|nr:hypothetical protein EV360DRAFT_91111 [Lentinula raphanica]
MRYTDPNATVIRSTNVSLNTNLREKGLGSDNSIHTHHCLSKRIYGIFRSDSDALVDEGYRALNEDEIELGCRGNGDEDARDTSVVAQMLIMEPSTSTAITEAVDLPPLFLPIPPDPPAIEVQGSPEGSESAPINILWNDRWEPLHIVNPSELFSAHDRSPLFKLVSERYRTIFDSEQPSFLVKGTDIPQLVQEFTKLVRKAIVEEDFAPILTEHRHFQM